MRIVEVTENKKQYLDLLLLADEQEDMVDRYLYKGKMYVLDDDGVKCECVVTDEGTGILEIKNIATVPPFQRKGYAKALIEFLVEKYRGQFSILQVGTGDSPLTMPLMSRTFPNTHRMRSFPRSACFGTASPRSWQEKTRSLSMASFGKAHEPRTMKRPSYGFPIADWFTRSAESTLAEFL